MKHIIILLAALLMSVAGYSNVVREGNTFIVKTTTTYKINDKSIGVYQDKNGNKYPLYQSKKGALYITKVSKKTGKEYKQYLPKDIQKQIKKEIKP